MNKFLEILKNNRLASIAAGLAFLLLLLLLVFLFRSPRFPDESPDSGRNQSGALQERRQLFQQFSQYLKENHGGLMLSEQLQPAVKDSKAARSAPITFRQQFRFLNQSLISELSEDFAAKQGMRTVIHPGCTSHPTDTACHEMDFIKGTDVWMRILLESIQPDYPEKGKKSEYMDRVETNGHQVPESPLSETARLAIVIDDLGYRMDVFNNLITLDYDITYAVLPQQTYSRETAEIAAQAGREVMLHLPMQPKDWPRFDPGLGALLLRDTQQEIRGKIALNLSTVPFVSGVNNHMGSAYTQYAEGLNTLMDTLDKNALFFLDSKTAPGRTARTAAEKHSVPYLSRDIFLDNDRDEDLIGKQLHKAARLAKKRGWAIAIGHPYDITYTVLAKQLPELEKQGVRIIKVADLLN